MIIREMTFDDISEVAELERRYSQTPWDATGLLSWWMRDDTLFLVAGEESTEGADGAEAPALEEGAAPAGRPEAAEGTGADGGNGDEAFCESDMEYVPPVVYGYVGLVMVPYESDITNITVSGDCRRQGIATALFQELFRRCPEKGVSVIHLEVRESNAPARALYEKLGFAADGRRKHYYTEPTEDAILMTRKLRDP